MPRSVTFAFSCVSRASTAQVPVKTPLVTEFVHALSACTPLAYSALQTSEMAIASSPIQQCWTSDLASRVGLPTQPRDDTGTASLPYTAQLRDSG
ncbi:hypothetical protein OH76DRAFT_1490826 [Lentinus brumalis]|uniref:Uncharacterized protein n=1 Tax=Lentinus brumalis TaxID=2498619 RepID=A0A371CHN5_9APHY|nr:hypothetical protein OH76DRAFT_1490826 [Polyporus brumalis]